MNLPITSICCDEFNKFIALSPKNSTPVIFDKQSSRTLVPTIPEMEIRCPVHSTLSGYQYTNSFLDESLEQRVLPKKEEFFDIMRALRNYPLMKKFESPKIPSTQTNLNMHTTAFLGGCFLTGSQTGSVIGYYPYKHSMKQIFNPSNNPITCLVTSPEFYGFAASAGNTIYVYEISQPYHSKPNQKKENMNFKKEIEAFNKLDLNYGNYCNQMIQMFNEETPQNDSFRYVDV